MNTILPESALSSPALVPIVIIFVVLVVFFFIGWWKILGKAGYSGFWSVLMIIPVVNVVIFLMVAFEDWPIFQYFEEQLKYALERQRYTIPENETVNREMLFPRYRSVSKATSENGEKAS